jgi:hypothetical protein
MIGNGDSGDGRREGRYGEADAGLGADDAASDSEYGGRDERDDGGAESTDDALDHGHVTELDVDAAHQAQQHE